MKKHIYTLLLLLLVGAGQAKAQCIPVYIYKFIAGDTVLQFNEDSVKHLVKTFLEANEAFNAEIGGTVSITDVRLIANDTGGTYRPIMSWSGFSVSGSDTAFLSFATKMATDANGLKFAPEQPPILCHTKLDCCVVSCEARNSHVGWLCICYQPRLDQGCITYCARMEFDPWSWIFHGSEL